MKWKRMGVWAGLTSGLFLGMAPVFGKQAINLGFSPFLVVALRTLLAAILLLIIVLVFKRQFLFIYPVGLLGCVMAGMTNGAGSVFYYLSLSRLDAGVGQLLYSTYPIFVAVWMALDHQPPSRLTLMRIGIAAIGVVLLTGHPDSRVDLTGVYLMLGSAVLYALHLPINQRVLLEVPAPTVTLYTLFAMSAVVLPVYFIFDFSWPAAEASWLPVFGLTLVTFFSRLTLFLGVKHLGGMQTAILGLGELLVAIVGSSLLLHETLSTVQWLGAGGLAISLLLISFEKPPPDRRRTGGGLFRWLRPPTPPTDLPWQPMD